MHRRCIELVKGGGEGTGDIGATMKRLAQETEQCSITVGGKVEPPLHRLAFPAEGDNEAVAPFAAGNAQRFEGDGLGYGFGLAGHGGGAVETDDDRAVAGVVSGIDRFIVTGFRLWRMFGQHTLQPIAVQHAFGAAGVPQSMEPLCVLLGVSAASVSSQMATIFSSLAALKPLPMPMCRRYQRAISARCAGSVQRQCCNNAQSQTDTVPRSLVWAEVRNNFTALRQRRSET